MSTQEQYIVQARDELNMALAARPGAPALQVLMDWFQAKRQFYKNQRSHQTGAGQLTAAIKEEVWEEACALVQDAIDGCSQ